MSLTQSYESQRDLLIGQLYKRSSTTVASGQATRYQKAHQRISVGAFGAHGGGADVRVNSKKCGI